MAGYALFLLSAAQWRATNQVAQVVSTLSDNRLSKSVVRGVTNILQQIWSSRIPVFGGCGLGGRRWVRKMAVGNRNPGKQPGIDFVHAGHIAPQGVHSTRAESTYVVVELTPTRCRCGCSDGHCAAQLQVCRLTCPMSAGTKRRHPQKAIARLPHRSPNVH